MTQTTTKNLFGAREVLTETNGQKVYYYRLSKLRELGHDVDSLPISVRV